MPRGSFDDTHSFASGQQPVSERMSHLTGAEQYVQLSVHGGAVFYPCCRHRAMIASAFCVSSIATATWSHGGHITQLVNR
jgi:hypothetical protein